MRRQRSPRFFPVSELAAAFKVHTATIYRLAAPFIVVASTFYRSPIRSTTTLPGPLSSENTPNG
jgi:hypothetical protein